MTHAALTALIPDELLKTGVIVTAWPDGMLKVQRRRGILTKVNLPEGGTKLVLRLDDGRTFDDPDFPWLAS
jgi:hypothetical protein